LAVTSGVSLPAILVPSAAKTHRKCDERRFLPSGLFDPPASTL
jgi:hypothetical protein